jgi:hypothetical protein
VIHFETPAGPQAQVDFARFVFPWGVWYALLVVLGYSRLLWCAVLGDEVIAAALIDRLVRHCHIVTIRGNSCRRRQPTDLWQTLHAPQDPDAAPTRRRRARQEGATI